MPGRETFRLGHGLTIELLADGLGTKIKYIIMTQINILFQVWAEL